MYNLFLEKHQPKYLTYFQTLEDCRQKQIECTKPMIKPLTVERTCQNILDSEFNLGFCQPHSDACVECDSLNI